MSNDNEECGQAKSHKHGKALRKGCGNPYLESRALWSEMYGDVQMRLDYAKRLILALVIVIGLCVLLVAYSSRQSAIKPYVSLLTNEQVVTVHDFESADAEKLQPKLATLLTKQFLQQARSLSTDTAVNTVNRIKAFSVASGPTAGVLKAYFATNNKSNITRQIIVQSILLKSHDTIDIRWQEIERDSHSGEVISKAPYSAQISYAFDASQLSETQLHHNPVGFYITELSWARDYVSQT